MKRWKQKITMVEAHAEGEVGRIVTDGIENLPDGTMLDLLNWCNNEGDALRHFLVYEPRGSAQMSTVLTVPPRHPDANIGFLVMQGDKTHAMSGSNTICLATVLLETGRIEMIEPRTEFVLDTASGLVNISAECQDGKCKNVTLQLADCYADSLDQIVEIDGHGQVTFDIAFGGIFYALVDVRQFGLSIIPDNARELCRIGSEIHRTVNREMDIHHPDYPGLEGLSYVMFTDINDDGSFRGATIMPPGRVDRSPCGTGNAARLAVMVARGHAVKGERFLAKSIIDSEFSVRIVDIKNQANGYPKITPQITGRGWIHGIHQIGVDPDDPFPQGFSITDCWGEARDLLNS